MTRRGAHAVYLDIDHPDYPELLQIRDIGNPMQNLFYAACIPDYWMQDMLNGDVNKRQLWADTLQSRKEKGLPYIFFSDNVNKGKPQIYKELNARINGSNLCLTGDTEVYIEYVKDAKQIVQQQATLISVIELVEAGQDVKVLSKVEGSNKLEFKRVVKAFRQGVKEVKAYTISGTKIIATPDHKFMSDDNFEFKEIQEFVGTHNLWNVSNENIKVEASDIFEAEVFDIEVEDTHNFAVAIGNDNFVIAHNCAEIALPSNNDESFVCCLASMNLELYDEWKDTDAVFWAILFLDAVLQEFIDKTKELEHFEPAHKFAERHRAVGLGVMGWHSYLQKNNIAFEDFEAMQLNNSIFKHISKQAMEASIELGQELGVAPIFNEVPDSQDTPRRNTTTMAIAPTTSSSSILGGASPGIEPFSSNYYKVGLAKGNFMRKNKYLDAKLTELGKNNEDVWRDILLHHGSVQHLSFLDDKTKRVFKTFRELSQMSIIQQAAQRQRYIDQMQSINLNIPSEMSPKDVHQLLVNAWQMGVKSIYYQRSESVAKELITNMVICNTCEA